jgi:hypothetical protein
MWPALDPSVLELEIARRFPVCTMAGQMGARRVPPIVTGTRCTAAFLDLNWHLQNHEESRNYELKKDKR